MAPIRFGSSVRCADPLPKLPHRDRRRVDGGGSVPAKKTSKKSSAKKSAKKTATATSRKSAGAKKSGARKKATAKKASAKKSAAKKSGAKKSVTKKAAPKKAGAKKATTAKAATPTEASTAKANPTKGAGAFTAETVNIGHVFGLRPRVNTAFRQEDFRTARSLLAEESYETLEDAVRAVVEKAHELGREHGKRPHRGRAQ